MAWICLAKHTLPLKRLFVRSLSRGIIGNDYEYQYLQQSKLPTMHFQVSLPRLPIPRLAHTCDRFLAAVQPIITNEQRKLTQLCVQDFRQGIGMDLNVLLKKADAANRHTSYISEPWFNMYLRDRSPLPINYNPLLVMKNEERADYGDQLTRATNLVISSLRFWRSLLSHQLEPEIYHLDPKRSNTKAFRLLVRLVPNAIATYAAYAMKAFPLDMSQYESLFGTTRIPKLSKDELFQQRDSKHILVMKGGNLYAVDVLDEHGHIELPQVILGRLKHVLDIHENHSNNTNGDVSAQVPLGVLTSGQRDVWALTRDHLCNQITAKNKWLLENEVDGALFCLCLDDAKDPQYNELDLRPFLKHLLAGKGINRWFDKSVSLLVGSDGTAAINFEHSWGDGVAVLRYFNEISKETLQRPFVNKSTIPLNVDHSEKSVRFLQFDIDEKIRADVSEAQNRMCKIDNGLDLHVLKYTKINKSICKEKGISPDAAMQLSFQLAYKQAFDRYVGTYESCSTAAFRHGRTETIRSCTKATKKFCDNVLSSTNNRLSTKDLMSLIVESSKVHGQLTKEAAMGQGFDRHLFGLKHIALANNIPLHDIYSSEAYRYLNHNIISTSTLSSDALLAGCFGPVVSNGLGIAYSIQESMCGTVVTSYREHCIGHQFVDSLSDSLEKIHHIFSHS